MRWKARSNSWPRTVGVWTSPALTLSKTAALKTREMSASIEYLHGRRRAGVSSSNFAPIDEVGRPFREGLYAFNHPREPFVFR